MSARTSKPKPAPLSWSKPEAAVPPEEKADRKTIDAAAIALKPVASDLPASVPAGTDRPVDAPEAVETLNLAIIRPDPLQGRRALPHDIRLAYQSGTLTAEEAAREWLKRADGGDEKERVKIQAYLDLADSLGERQINPISVIALPRGGLYRFVIESGERRFWAMWLRVVRGQQSEKTIQAIVRPTFSTWRQIGENAQQEGMTAIELALTVARAWLAQLDIVADPVGDSVATGYDFYRKALWPAERIKEGMKKFPNGTWAPVEKVMRRSRPHLERILSLLNLEDEALEEANRYGVNERVLRAILSEDVNAPKRLQLVRDAGRYKLVGPDIKMLVQAQDYDATLKALIPLRAGGEEETAAEGAPKTKKTNAIVRPRGTLGLSRVTSYSTMVKRILQSESKTRLQAARALARETAASLSKAAARELLSDYEPLMVELRKKARGK